MNSNKYVKLWLVNYGSFCQRFSIVCFVTIGMYLLPHQLLNGFVSEECGQLVSYVLRGSVNVERKVYRGGIMGNGAILASSEVA